MDPTFVPLNDFGPADIAQPKIDIILRHERLGAHHFSAFQPMPEVADIITPKFLIETIVGDRLAIGESKDFYVVAWFVRKDERMLEAGLASRLADNPGKPIATGSELVLVIADRPAADA